VLLLALRQCAIRVGRAIPLSVRAFVEFGGSSTSYAAKPDTRPIVLCIMGFVAEPRELFCDGGLAGCGYPGNKD